MITKCLRVSALECTKHRFTETLGERRVEGRRLVEAEIGTFGQIVRTRIFGWKNKIEILEGMNRVCESVSMILLFSEACKELNWVCTYFM